MTVLVKWQMNLDNTIRCFTKVDLCVSDSAEVILEWIDAAP